MATPARAKLASAIRGEGPRRNPSLARLFFVTRSLCVGLPARLVSTLETYQLFPGIIMCLVEFSAEWRLRVADAAYQGSFPWCAASVFLRATVL